jgi:hypothetical protein
MRPWLALLALGCNDDNGSGDSATGGDGEADADTDADSDADSDTDSDADSELPYITAADAACSFHETGSQYWLWTVSASADDPQGVKTVDTIGNVDVLDAATEKIAATYALACTAKGVCATGFKADADGILCDDPKQWTFRFTVVDEDENVSDPFDVIGRLAGD